MLAVVGRASERHEVESALEGGREGAGDDALCGAVAPAVDDRVVGALERLPGLLELVRDELAPPVVERFEGAPCVTIVLGCDRERDRVRALDRKSVV